ncbi:uncharacterized protein TNCV_348041 [Trichonephila clavipes]|nr:uncharacterized protein TNCV_348041 [Trichonephila clavipes]
MSSLAFFAHANVFHHGGQPVPVELSIASIPEDGTEPKVICITVDHSNLLTTDKDRRANRYINERLSLKSHLPGSVPLEYLDFCVRGKFCHLAQGNKGLIVVKGSDQRKIFEKLGLFTINLEILPHFRDLNDHSLPDHLHDDVHENFDISECTMGKLYRFARYLQYFNKLQAECKKQTSHLVEPVAKSPGVAEQCDVNIPSLIQRRVGRNKQLCGSVTAICRGKRQTDRADSIQLVVPLPVLTFGLAHGSWGSRSYITNHSTTDSVCCAAFGVRSYHRGCGSPLVKVSDHGRYVMSSSPVSLKICRVGKRCTLNLSRAQTSSCC